MIQIVIDNLKKVDNEVSKKLLDIYTSNQEEKGADYYASTVFNSNDEYNKMSNIITGKLISYQIKRIVETPLIFIKGNQSPIFYSSKNQGIAFGGTLIDYITKKPLLIFVVDKATTQYTFTVANYNNDTNTYDIFNSRKSCSNFNELLDFTYDKLGENIDKFVQNPFGIKK